MSVNQVSQPIAGTQVLDLQEGPCVSVNQFSPLVAGTQVLDLKSWTNFRDHNNPEIIICPRSCDDDLWINF